MPDESVDILVLGAGWSSQFLIPMLEESGVSYAKTTRQGGPNSIKFIFDPDSLNKEPFLRLPPARTVVVVFPITVPGGSKRLTELYCTTHNECSPLFVQLGSSGIWKEGSNNGQIWIDRENTFDSSNARAVSEQELINLHDSGMSCTVLNFAGLWGENRRFQNWISRVAPTKDALRAKGSVHAVHGLDVAQAILAVHRNPKSAAGQRWLITDGRVYDWWELASAWGSIGVDSGRAHAQWVRELMEETDVRALPRSPEIMGRGLDSRAFWKTFGISPLRARLEKFD